MPILYSCKHSGDQYRITKWDDGEVQASYLCTTTECECPAGPRPMCRHREMLPLFIHRKATDSSWWFDYDRGGWVQMQAEVEFEPLPEGVQVFTLGPDTDMGELHNAIADAVGEPEARIEPITATEVAERFAEMKHPDNPIVETLVDHIFEVMQKHDLVPAPTKPSWRRF